MVNLFSPITYTTDVNTVTLPYFTGQANWAGGIYYGYNWGFTPVFNFEYNNVYSDYNFFGLKRNNTGGIFDFFPINYTYCNPYTYTVKNYSAPVQKVYTPPENNTKTDLRSDFADIAGKYSGCSEKNATHLKFCINPTCKNEDPNNKEWCTDFVTYVVKEAYANKGQKPPEGFGDHDVGRLKNWAIQNGYFYNIVGQTNKGNLISQNIKKGDIVIFNEPKPDGKLASHTGFVKEIYKDGSFSTIEGNRNDKVGSATYSPDYYQLSGFIQLT